MTDEEARRFGSAFMEILTYINSLTGNLNIVGITMDKALKDQGIILPNKTQ
jgi:hypothetical protein